MPTLDDRVAIVTGAAQGLGAAEALALAAEGARVVLNDLPGPALDEVADRIFAIGGEAVVRAGDVADWSTGEALVRTAVDTFGRLDVLVNNAGVLRDRMIFSMSESEWDTVVRVHLRGHFVTTRFATAHWRARSKAGDPVAASVVNTASEAFLLGSAGQANYAAAKGGIVALTLATARGCAPYGVRANAICPRARTAMTGELMGPAPADRPDPMAPERVTPLVTYLAGPASARVTGEVFVVHSDVVALLGPPRVRAEFHAASGQWTVTELDAALAGVFVEDPPRPGFVCEETLPLAESTFGENRG